MIIIINYCSRTAALRTSTNTDDTITAYAIIRTVYHAYYIYPLVFIIFILYRSAFLFRTIQSYSFDINISSQYSFVELLFFPHDTIIQYIFAELFYIIIPSVLSLHDISILFVYSISVYFPCLYLLYILSPYVIAPYCLYLLYLVKYLVCCYYNCYIYCMCLDR